MEWVVRYGMVGGVWNGWLILVTVAVRCSATSE